MTERVRELESRELDAPLARNLLEQMLRIRKFEAAAAEQYSVGHIRGFLHLYDGEEAVAVGTMRQLGPDDAVVSTYREHGHALARGLSARSLMAEMFGRLPGCTRGRGGSMHLFDRRRRFFGGNAIVAGGLPIAVGLALADKVAGRRRVTVCFFGDGAVAEGGFHESLNLAALWQVPLLFCCENNLYAMGTALSRCEAQTNLVIKAKSYAVPAAAVDGMDVFAVSEAVAGAAAHVRNGLGPFFLEFQTYRFRAHSMFDAQLYREQGEIEQWKRRGPIVGLQARLREQGELDDEQLAAMHARIDAELADAVEFATSAEPEPVAQLHRFVYSESSEQV